MYFFIDDLKQYFSLMKIPDVMLYLISRIVYISRISPCGGLDLACCQLPTQLLSHSCTSGGQGTKQGEEACGVR